MTTKKTNTDTDYNYNQIKKVKLEGATNVEIAAMSLNTSHTGLILFNTDYGIIGGWNGASWLWSFSVELVAASSGTGSSIIKSRTQGSDGKRTFQLKTIKNIDSNIAVTADTDNIKIDLSAAAAAKLLPTSLTPILGAGKSILVGSTDGVNWSNRICVLPGNLYLYNTDNVDATTASASYLQLSSSGELLLSYNSVSGLSATGGLHSYESPVYNGGTIVSNTGTTRLWSKTANVASEIIVFSSTNVNDNTITLNTKKLKITATTPAVGKVWTCTNTDGSGEWQTPTGGATATLGYYPITGQTISVTGAASEITGVAESDSNNDTLEFLNPSLSEYSLAIRSMGGGDTVIRNFIVAGCNTIFKQAAVLVIPDGLAVVVRVIADPDNSRTAFISWSEQLSQ